MLRDKKYYDINKDDLGTVLSETGFIAEMFCIGVDIILGPIFDLVGRKLPVVIGLFICGFSFIGFPMFTQIYPWYCLLKVLSNLGVLVGLNAPFLPDYISSGSVGLASAYAVIMQTLAGIVASSLIPLIGSIIDDQKWLYYGIGSFNLIFAIILSFGLKDVLKEKENIINIGKEVDSENQESKCGMVIKLGKIVWKEFRNDA